MGLPRVVVLGGGMAGLTTAWELSAGDWRERYASITVHQRGWRLGGKGASSRGEHGRIEEHGLHVLLGYYDATFRVLREVYAELDRARTDPGCPLLDWTDALVPSGDVGLVDVSGPTAPEPFVTRFSRDGRLPGEPGSEDRPLRPVDVVVRGLRLLADFHGAGVADGPVEVYLSTSPRPRPAGGADPAAALRAGLLTTLAGAAVTLERVTDALGALPSASLLGPVREVLELVREQLRAATVRAPRPGAPPSSSTWSPPSCWG